MTDAQKEELKKLSDDLVAVQKQFKEYRSLTSVLGVLIFLVSVTMTLSLIVLPVPHSIIIGVGSIIVLIAIFRAWGVRRERISAAVLAVQGRIRAAELAILRES